MKLNDLKPAQGGATKKRHRRGRGRASGLGKTGGRGHDGQRSRSGLQPRIGFEGGQNPLLIRLPKRGFSNRRFGKDLAVVNVGDLNRFDSGTTVDIDLLLEEGLVNKRKTRLHGVKVLGNGELEKELTVVATEFSKSAVEKIEEKGGKAEVK